MNERADDAVERLIRRHERGAERIVAKVRIGVALFLVFSFVLSMEFLRPPELRAGSNRVAGTAIATILSFGLTGVLALWSLRAGRFRSWMPYVFVLGDLGLILGIMALATLGNHLSAAMALSIPVAFAIPAVLSLGGLRYDARVQAFATGVFVLGILGIALAVEGRGEATVASPPARFFDTPTLVIRAAMIVVVGAVTVVGAMRARALLRSVADESVRRARLARFLPAEIAERAGGPEGEALRRGLHQTASIAFVDIRDFTGRAETMDPAAVAGVITEFRRRVAAAARASGGIVDKFVGDGALVVFGVPDRVPDDAARALAFARDLLGRIGDWNRSEPRHPPIRIGIGIHRGEVFCGLIGDEARLEFTVLGDAVNVASRLEQLTKTYAVPLLISQAVREAAGEERGWREVAREAPRGREAPVTILAAEDQPARSPEAAPSLTS